MSTVSRALEDNPRVVVKGLGWKFGTQEIDGEGAQAKPASADGTPDAGAGTTRPALFRRQSAFIDAEIRPFSGDYRGAIADIQRFVSRLLQEAPVAEARVVKYPLNVSPTTTLSGNTLDDRSQQSTNAPFRVVIVLKPNT